MDNTTQLFSFSINLWYDQRWVNKTTGMATIYLQVVIDRKAHPFPLKLRWPVDLIDKDRCLLLAREKNDAIAYDYNLIIMSERSKFTEIQTTYRLRKEPLDIITFRKEVLVFDQRECFLSFYDRENKRLLKKKEIDFKTYQNNDATRKTLIEYDKVCLFKNIDHKWFKGFRTFLNSYAHRPGVKYKPSTIWGKIKAVKTFLNLAALEPLIHVNKEALDFPNPEPEPKTTFLNNEEVRNMLLLLERDDLTETERTCLSAFLFTCFTSLRISDLYRANHSWTISKGFLDFIPYKNRKKARALHIPIMPLASKFVQNVKGKYFDLPSEQKYNMYLKRLANLANIKKRLTSHVGRHTFGYLYMTTIGNLKGLQEILGHTKISTTERYAHLDDTYQVESILKIQDSFSDLLMRVV